MHQSVQLDDREHEEAINREIAHIRDSGALGRSTKLRDLFDYLVERSRSGTPPREVEIVQDVFGRTGQAGDDGAARVYIHRLRRRLEEIYRDRSDAALRLALPLGEYRLVAETGERDEATPRPAAAPGLSGQWRAMAIGAAVALLLAAVLAYFALPRPGASSPDVAYALKSPIWAPLFANDRRIIVAQGDHYLFAEKGPDGQPARLVRDFRIHSREELDANLLRNPADAERQGDAGVSYVPAILPRAQLYLSRILLTSPNVRVLPASQLSAEAMLSQNIVYLGLTSGLGPLRATVGAGSRFETGADRDEIRDLRTGQVYRASAAKGEGPHRQFALLSLYPGKEANRFIVLAATSEMGLVGLVETLADPRRLDQLVRAIGNADAAEALYQVDSQGSGVLAVRLIATNRRSPPRIWQP